MSHKINELSITINQRWNSVFFVIVAEFNTHSLAKLTIIFDQNSKEVNVGFSTMAVRNFVMRI